MTMKGLINFFFSLKEYFILAKENIKNIKLILNGFYNSFIFKFLNKRDRDKITNRRDLCKKCMFASNNILKDLYKSYRFDIHCSICKCNIKAKTSELSERCLVNNW